MRRWSEQWFVAAVALALGCAHAPPGPPPAARAWPPSPAPPRARWLESLPSATASRPSGFVRFLRAVLGTSEDGENDSPLARPFGLALSGGDLIVADPDAPGVFRLPTGGVPLPIGCRGRDWVAPMAVAARADGTLFVADGGAPAVVRIDPGGACAALGAGLERPTGLALSGDRLYVVDPPRHRVVALTPDDGRVVGGFGEAGEAPGQLYYPTGIASDGDGSLLVVDALNFRVCRFDARGSVLSCFGERGDEGGRLARPKAVAVGPRESVLVTDAQRGLVLVFTRQGNFDFAFGEPGKEPGQLDLPSGLAVDGDRVLVASSLNHRIEAYQLLGDAP